MDKKGSGDELGRIEIPNVGELVIKDDGDPDSFACASIETADGNEYRFGTTNLSFRKDKDGDKKFIEGLKQAGASSMGSPSKPRNQGSVFPSGPFKCHDCNKTWPGKMNQTPGDVHDTCPDCHDD